MPHETLAPSQDKEDFVANEEKLKNLGGKNIADMSDEEAETFLAERKKLKADNEGLIGKAQEEATAENEMRDTYDRAHQENRELDAANAAQEAAAKQQAEAAERAKQAEQDAAARQKELDEATALAERIKNGTPGDEEPDTLKMEEGGEALVRVESSGADNNIKEVSVQQEEQAPETEEQKLAKKELAEKHPNIEVSTSENFPGSILVKEKDGNKVYSVREENGEIVGNVTTIMKDGSFGATQRLHADDIEILEKNSVRDILQRAQQVKPDSFEDLRAKEQAKELERKNDDKLFQAINGFAKGHGYMKREELKEYVSGMNSEAQKRIAERLFDSYGKEGLEILVYKGYEAYKALKGTSFSDRFRELEDERLVSEGFGHFTL